MIDHAIKLALTGLLSCLLWQCKCLGQYHDSSALINAAIGLYHELPSGTRFTLSADSLANQLKLKRVIRRCYKDAILRTSTISKYNADGTISSVVTKFNADTDSIVLSIERDKSNIFHYNYSFPYDAIKDSVSISFEDVIDFYKLNEKRYDMKVSMQFTDSETVNVTASVNEEFVDKRHGLNLYLYSSNLDEELLAEPVKSKWDTVFADGFMVLTKINIAPPGYFLKSTNYFDTTVRKLRRYEVYSKKQSGEWRLSLSQNYHYDELGRRSKIEELITGTTTMKRIDSIIYYPNGKIRSHKIYSPNDNLTFRDSVFSTDGNLIYEYLYGQDYSPKAGDVGGAHSDTFYTYNLLGQLKQLQRFHNGVLVYSEEYDYEYWED